MQANTDSEFTGLYNKTSKQLLTPGRGQHSLTTLCYSDTWQSQQVTTVPRVIPSGEVFVSGREKLTTTLIPRSETIFIKYIRAIL